MFYKLVQTKQPYDLKSRDGWRRETLGRYVFAGAEVGNDYLGNYLYGVIGKEMFANISFNVFGYNIGTDSYLVNAAGLAQQWSDNGKFEGSFNWLWIRISSGLSESGDNKEDVQMIKDGIERWYKNYGK